MVQNKITIFSNSYLDSKKNWLGFTTGRPDVKPQGNRNIAVKPNGVYQPIIACFSRHPMPFWNQSR
jgi:hypothetical protein